jgi:glycosyltransferase involved in cell wall biosynthesis
VESLLAQSMDDFELIISDNASTDNTYDICCEFARRDDRISVHRNETNVGAAANFNRVFALASAEYFKWAACDDLYEPSYLTRCTEVLENRPEVILCHARTEEIDASGRSIGLDEFPLRLDSDDASVRFRDMIVIRHACAIVFGVIRRDVLAKTPKIGAYVSSDRVLLAKLALMGSMVELAEPLYKRRKHRDNSVWLDKRSDLLAWFDPSQRDKINLPYWRAWGELCRVVMRTPLQSRERLRCCKALVEHALGRRPDLTRDIVTGIRKRASRVRPINATVQAIKHRGRSRTSAE